MSESTIAYLLMAMVALSFFIVTGFIAFYRGREAR
jgi:hypothetical protein